MSLVRAVVGGWTEWGREVWSSPSNEVTMELNGSLSSAVDTSPTSFTSCYNLQFYNLQIRDPAAGTVSDAVVPPTAFANTKVCKKRK